MDHLTVKQKMRNIIAANEHLYNLSSPAIVAEIANEKIVKLKPAIRKKQPVKPIQELSESEEEITKEVSAIPIYIKNIIANLVEYIKTYKRYPTTQVRNVFCVRQKYLKFNKQQRQHYNVLPEWETYLKLFNYYNANQVRHNNRDYSLAMLDKVKTHGLEMFDLVDFV